MAGTAWSKPSDNSRVLTSNNGSLHLYTFDSFSPSKPRVFRGPVGKVTVETKVEMDYTTRVATMDRFETRKPREETVKHQHVENFLWVYGGTVRVAFSEATSFISLGAKQGLSKHVALQNLLAELRQRAPQAVVDERLMGPSLSLPMVGPERSQEVLAGLMDQSIQASLWP